LKLIRLSFQIILLIWSISGFAQKFEAESATLAGGAAIQADASASGGYFVAQKDGSLSFNITLEAGSYNIYVSATAPSGNKTNRFWIDGSNIDFSLSQNAAYLRLKVISNLNLKAGAHAVSITKSWGWINIDYIEFEKVQSSAIFNINKTLVTPNPTEQATRLYQFLYDTYRKKIISGVMTLNSMDEVTWLKTNTGKEPALVGIDFMHCNRGYTWYNNDIPIIDARTYYERNGIPAMCWHWRDPSRKTEEFYSNKTSFDVTKIFDTISVEYKAMISDIDYISGQLKKLQALNVPVIWRPLHEAAGGWFWWGAKGAEPCKKLYQVMYDRMVNYNGVRNLIWVWTREPNDDAWYPGDEYVDIVGRDIYKTGDHTSQVLEFNDMNVRYGGKKMITLSECGSFPDVDNLIADQAGWLYFMPWYGDYTRLNTYNTLDLWKKMFASDYVLTLDEMPNLKSYTTDIKEIELPTNSTDIRIFPTYINNELNIQSNEAIKSVAVFDSQGLLVQSLVFSSDTAVLSFSEFVSGIYFIKVGGSKAVMVFKK
jgi:mannan endo-1,4-beta-mannosidase